MGNRKDAEGIAGKLQRNITGKIKISRYLFCQQSDIYL